jgi:threonine dehydrogenase-like Zn-dependent dehydrogenase
MMSNDTTAPRTMRAAQMTAFRRPLEVGEVPVAAPRADGAVVRVEACGVCRSDWHFWNNNPFHREKFARLPKAISTQGERAHTYEVGEIA